MNIWTWIKSWFQGPPAVSPVQEEEQLEDMPVIGTILKLGEAAAGDRVE